MHALALQATEPHHVPAALRAYLWCSLAMSLFISLVMSMAFVAGPNPRGESLARPFTLALLVLLTLHVGYLLAPLAAGASWWRWSFWLMAMPAAIIVLCSLIPMFQSLRWTPPDGASRIPALTRMGVTTLIASAIYAGPPLTLWFVQPAASNQAASSGL